MKKNGSFIHQERMLFESNLHNVIASQPTLVWFKARYITRNDTTDRHIRVFGAWIQPMLQCKHLFMSASTQIHPFV